MESKILLFIGGVYGFIALVVAAASLVMRDRDKMKALWTVLLTEIVIMGLVFVPAFFGGIFFAAVMALIGLRSLWELQALHPTTPAAMRILGVLGGAALFGAAHFSLDTGGLLVALPLLLLVAAVFPEMTRDSFAGAAMVWMGTVYTCLFLSHAIYIQRMPAGFALIVFLYGMSEVNDGFALVFGKLFGRKRIFPELSPNKTWGGTLVGAVCACLAALAFHATVGILSFWQALVGALIVVICSVAGDLVGSRIKRGVGVKDFGNVLPMQGGVLDIYDSLIFASPVFYAYLRFGAEYL